MIDSNEISSVGKKMVLIVSFDPKNYREGLSCFVNFY